MSVYTIYFKGGEKTKYLRPVLNREAYLTLRNGGEQQTILKAVRSGDESRKNRLVQMNYSCLPNADGSLKGSTRMSSTVGMDIDHIPADEMQSRTVAIWLSGTWSMSMPTVLLMRVVPFSEPSSLGRHE